MTAQRQLIFWSAGFGFFLLLVFVFKAVLLPFVLGAVIAYFLNPVVGLLDRAGLRRKYAGMLILIMFFLVIFVVLAALLPVLVREMEGFIGDLPAYRDQLVALAEPLAQKFQKLTGAEASGLKDFLKQNAGSGAPLAQNMWSGIAAGGMAVAGFLSLLVVMPFAAYYMIREWPGITQWGIDLLPRDHKDTVMEILKEIDKKLSGFVRGQISVALVLGVSYALALFLAGLKYGILIGIAAGLLSVIPMVGSTVGLITAVGVAWFQSGEWSFVLLIAAIFLIGQVIEGNFLTPKLVGDSVGLHPLWVFFALLAGGSLFGILGMLLAVPVAAVASVLIGFAIRRYKASPYYKGKGPAKKKGG